MPPPSRETILQDVWVQASELPVVGHFRIGHIKQPMGLENYNSSKFLTFMERGALQDAFLQEYDPGFLFWNNALVDQVWWGTGFYRIDAEETGVDFGDGEYAWTSRLCYLLWDQPDHRYLMHVGGSYSHRNSEFDPVDRRRSRPLPRTARSSRHATAGRYRNARRRQRRPGRRRSRLGSRSTVDPSRVSLDQHRQRFHPRRGAPSATSICTAITSS